MAAFQVVQTGHIGQTLDYVKSGVLYRGVEPRMVMVTAETDLADLPDIYEPGTIAFTAGKQNEWQLSADGEWVSTTPEAPADENG